MTEITPTDLLDRRRNLIEFYRSATGRACMQMFMTDILAKGGYDSSFGPVPFRLIDWGKRHPEAKLEEGVQVPLDIVESAMEAEAIKYCAKAAWLTETSPLYLVTEDMCNLIEYAADAKMPDAGITPEDLPSRTGLVVLEEPWIVTDKWRRTTVVSGFIWEHTTDQHVIISALSDLTDGRDNDSTNFFNTFIEDNTPRAGILRRVASLMLFDQMRIPMGLNISQLSVDDEYIKGNPTADPRHIINLVRAFWSISQEVYISNEQATIPRATIKREVRFGLSNNPKIRIIKLRHRSDARKPEGEGGRLKHRFTVCGHWRRQAYGPNRSLRRMRWVAPFVKGPDGAPWLTGQKIYRLER